MTKRSLMLAGGGLKIAFQAGVLQVWLDNAAIARGAPGEFGRTITVREIKSEVALQSL